MTRPSFAPALRHQIAIAAVFSAMLILALLLASNSALAAGVSGQIGRPWTPSAEFEGKELLELEQVGIDPSDGSVFIANSDVNFEKTIIRKFSAAGVFEGAVTLSGRGYVGIAVDPVIHQFYIVADASAKTEAQKILAFSTIPVAEQLVPAAVSELPLPEGLKNPQELVLNPSTGALVVVAKGESGSTVLQRVDVDRATGIGTVSGRFVAEEEALARAVTINKAGETYVVSKFEQSLPEPITAEVLPAEFSASSTPTPVPGFKAFIEAEDTEGNGTPLIIRGPNPKANFGPQVAVSTSATGEDTLYWKVEAATEEIVIESFSVGGKERLGVFGGGSSPGECTISSPAAALVGEEDGNLAVLDQGTILGSQGAPLEISPSAYQFGPGGSGCPAPTPGFKLESEGHTVTSVQSGSAGSTVTFNGAETALNAAPALEGGTWKVEGPEEFSEPITGSSPTLSHKFRVPGHYTIRLTIEAEVVAEHLKKVFSAQPRTLEVTPNPSLSLPSVTGVTPAGGSTAGGTEVTITGSNLSDTAEVKFGSTPVICAETKATCEVISDTEVKATSPALPVGTVDVHAITGAGESPTNAPADEFTTAVPPEVSGVSPNKGPAAGGTEVTITGTNLTDVTEVKFGTVGVVCTDSVSTCKVESDTEIKATTPAMPAGELDVHAVDGAIESPTAAPADVFTAVPAKFTLTVAKAGTGAGTVSSSPGGINCGTACAASFNEHTSVTLTATAASGSTFVGWEGACSGTTSPCVVPMNAAETVTATFNTNPPTDENKTPENKTENKTTPENKTTTPVETHPGPGPGPTKTKAEILAAQRKAALKKCQKLKGKAKGMCVKKANQIGKPKPKKAKKPKKK